LTERYRYLEPPTLKEGKREVELQVGKDNLFMTGFFDMEIWERSKKRLAADISHRCGGI